MSDASIDYLLRSVSQLSQRLQAEQDKGWHVVTEARCAIQNLRLKCQEQACQIAELEAENERMRRGIGEIGLHFISGNSVPVDRATITLADYQRWRERMGLNTSKAQS